MPGAAEKKWDHGAELDLCIAMIHGNQDAADRIKHNWGKISTYMANMGYGFTKDAIGQHFTKVIMKDFKKRHGDDLLASATPKKPVATPKKRTPAKRPKTEDTDDDEDDDNDDDDDDDKDKVDTPSKKRVKTEEVEVDKQERRLRERSSTVRDNNDEFEKWIRNDQQDEK